MPSYEEVADAARTVRNQAIDAAWLQYNVALDVYCAERRAAEAAAGTDDGAVGRAWFEYNIVVSEAGVERDAAVNAAVAQYAAVVAALEHTAE